MKEKTENLLLHICEQLKGEDTFGSVVLNKVLYYIDNISYLKTGKPISEFTYIKQDMGPTPSPRQFLSLRDKLIAEGRFTILEENCFGKTKKRPVSLQYPDLDSFSGEEMHLIDSVVNAFKKVNGTDASNFSHEEICWQIARPMEELPFHTYLLTKEPLNESDIEWATSILQKRG